MVTMPARASLTSALGPTPGSFRTSNGARYEASRPAGTTVMPPGLRASLATLATTLHEATPSEHVRLVDPRPLELPVERISISQEETFERDIGELEILHDELRRMAEGVARYLAGRGECARTVTTKVRYPDFAIRSRSTTLAAGIDDAETIGDLACSLLDRALHDRPGPLRLVGVGVSNLEAHRQLALG